MKETGIIMSGDHPQKILDGRKTMTRQVIKPQPEPSDTHDWYWKPGGMLCSDNYFREQAPYHCPYGQVGDLLWVRENWEIEMIDYPMAEVSYVADVYGHADHDIYIADKKLPKDLDRIQPSIFMPRWASRLTQTITEIRVERLQDITHDDCIREGIVPSIPDWHFSTPADYIKYVKKQYAILWDSLNGKKYPWSGNWWVWVLSWL